MFIGSVGTNMAISPSEVLLHKLVKVPQLLRTTTSLINKVLNEDIEHDSLLGMRKVALVSTSSRFYTASRALLTLPIKKLSSLRNRAWDRPRRVPCPRSAYSG